MNIYASNAEMSSMNDSSDISEHDSYLSEKLDCMPEIGDNFSDSSRQER